jgi:hypothetical protein
VCLIRVSQVKGSVQLGQDDSYTGACRRRRSDYRLECERTIHLSQVGIGSGGRLYGGYQAQRDEFVADTGDG